MKAEERINSDSYTDIEYHQFDAQPGLKRAMAVAGVLTWPMTVPLALVSRLSDFIFRTASEWLAIIPFMFGVVTRYEFYRFALTRCGENVQVGFGTVFIYRDVEIGDNVSIGNFITVHHCDIGSYALIADGCRLCSGAKYHRYDRRDIPMALQGGQLKRIAIGEDTWIGANAVIMDNVGEGSIVGAGSIVTSPVEPFSVVMGNPAVVNSALTERRRAGRKDNADGGAGAGENESDDEKSED